ncbi:MAG: putative zinc-binding metallopeptidase [Candidatus Aminicenantes bacterium]|nr:putative zinc-binding metallopeptidase [Candidatus Aminicenantes bacterium]
MTEIHQLLFNKATRKLEVLTTPVNRLGLDLKSSLLQQPIDRLLARIKRRGVMLKPHFYFGEDWGCVKGTANIEIGFYDADALLKELNKENRGWLNDARVIDYLLRHETGHAFCYAHRLYKNKEFRSVFGVKGKFFDTYPATDRFKPHPWSRDFVNPNRDHYAQKHPDEDFAETFSVWLSLPAGWKKAYRRKRRALGKLEYVTRLVRHYGDKPALVPPNPKDLDEPAEDIKATVAEILSAPLSRYRAKATGYIDPMLRKIGHYRSRQVGSGMVPLADVIGAHRKFIIEALVRTTRVTTAQASSLTGKMLSRSKAMHLYIPLSAKDKKLIDVVTLATTLAVRFAMKGTILPRR